jgi:hypothetical protein
MLVCAVCAGGAHTPTRSDGGSVRGRGWPSHLARAPTCRACLCVGIAAARVRRPPSSARQVESVELRLIVVRVRVQGVEVRHAPNVGDANLAVDHEACFADLLSGLDDEGNRHVQSRPARDRTLTFLPSRTTRPRKPSYLILVEPIGPAWTSLAEVGTQYLKSLLMRGQRGSAVPHWEYEPPVNYTST